MGNQKIRILLADDQQEMRKVVAGLLKDGFDVIADVANGERAIEAAVRLTPDLLIFDISMPVLNGLEAALCLKDSGSGAKLIFLTVNQDPDILETAFSVGALGYVLKQHLATDLLPAIRQVMNDHIFVSPTMLVEKNHPHQPVGG